MAETKTMKTLIGTAREQERFGEKGWEIRYRKPDGTQPRQWFRTRRALEDFTRDEYDRQQRVRRGLPEPGRPVTFKQLVHLITEQEPEDRWRDEMLAYPLARFGQEQVRRIRSEEVSKWIYDLEGAKTGKPLSGKTKQHILAAFRAILERGITWGYLDVNPVRPAAVRAPRAVPTEVHPFESWAEVYAVARAAGERCGPMIRFACATGLRPQEYLALTAADIDRENRECHVRRTVVKGKVKASGKTRGSLRTVQLTDEALAALEALPAKLRPSRFRPDRIVFEAPKGGHWNLNNLRNRVWKEAVEKAADEEGKPLGLAARPLYQTRHTFATLALAQIGNLDWISEQLGHADSAITRRHYARWLPAADKRNLALLNEAWNKETTKLGVPGTCHAEEAK